MIRRERRDGGEARGNEEREKERIEKESRERIEIERKERKEGVDEGSASLEINVRDLKSLVKASRAHYF